MRANTSSLRLFFLAMWQLIIGYGVALAAVLGLFLYRLGTLVNGFNSSELAARASSSTWWFVVKDPLNAPHKLLQFLIQTSGHHGLFAMRLASVIFSGVFVVMFYYVVLKWHTQRVALLGTLLLVTSSWLLHIGRAATPDILQLSIITAFAYGAWLQYTKRSGLALLLGSCLAAILLYIPGFIWYVIGAIVWQHKRIMGLAKEAPIFASMCVILFVVLLIPLALAIKQNLVLLQSVFGFSLIRPLYINNLSSNFVHIPEMLLLKGPNNPALWLGRLPLLDVFSATMVVLGAYAYFFRRRLDRTKLLGGTLLISVFLITIGGVAKIDLLLMPLYLLAIAGITLMLQRWFTVFPRNPVARALGTLLITLAVVATSYYHLSHYFIAWPNTPATKSVYNLRP